MGRIHVLYMCRGVYCLRTKLNLVHNMYIMHGMGVNTNYIVLCMGVGVTSFVCVPVQR
jgi:hypothetical protein